MAQARTPIRRGGLLAAASLLLLVMVGVVARGTRVLVPVWKAGTLYAPDQIVSFGGADYRCLQAHTALAGQAPPAAPALWAPSSDAPPVATTAPAPAVQPVAAPIVAPAAAPTYDALIPRPASATVAEGVFALDEGAAIAVEPATAELKQIAAYLAERLRPATGYALPVQAAAGAPVPGGILLTTVGADPTLGEEGYLLTVTPEQVTLAAYRPAGLFRGIQTIRQVLPAAVERPALQPGPWTIRAGVIRDTPRFGWRGAMLDVARHFFSVADVKRYIDLLALYKINRFHLHLSDDQGWRIVINSWPRLATYGGSTEVGGGAGGYYTQAEYAEIVAYAQSRYITLIPEIDLPGHTNAALASYPELNCNDVAPPLYTGIEVGFSSLCIDKEITYTFVEDVVRELAAITPGPYIHIGGDETMATPPDDYRTFIARVQAIVTAHGKQPIGWEEIAQGRLVPGAVVQHWANADRTRDAVQQGAKLIMSPASRSYLDMKYDETSPLGLVWAGLIEVEHGYTWDPAVLVAGVPAESILGVEAPLWSETISTMEELEFLAFPRLPGYAELGWSPAAGHSWAEYRERLADHSARLRALGINFYRSPQVDWEKEHVGREK
ncbi:MAG TPA: family 20 glycosylhydrolase [Roseiflexaceae bacterium]|nr:family 20 glycosylhydrolase [Roseiflexaceae bacterium]